MGKPYFLDLRERICSYVAKGNSARSTGRLFGVSAAAAVRFAAEHRDHGVAAAKSQGHPAGKFGKLAPHRNFLLEVVQAEPDITPRELAAATGSSTACPVCANSPIGWSSSTRRPSRRTSRGCAGEPLSGKGYMEQHPSENGACKPL